MKTQAPAIQLLALTLSLSAAALFAGCSTDHMRSGGTASLSDSSRVQGRDLGRGGATSGGLSSLDHQGNAADYSVYDARQIQQQQQAQPR